MTDSTEETTGFADAEAVKKTIVAWTQALLDGRYMTWLDYWDQDCLLMPPDHATLEGHDQVLAFARESLAGAGEFEFTDWRIEGQGHMAAVANHIRWGDNRVRQMIALRRRAKGWKVQMVMINNEAGE